MSLLDQFKTDFVMLEKKRTPDGLGGYSTVWAESVPFSAAFEYESAPQMITAEQQGVSRVYRMYVDKTLDMEYHEVFKRLEDGQIFRVTNPGVDRHTPSTSALNKRLIEVEKWELPHETGV